MNISRPLLFLFIASLICGCERAYDITEAGIQPYTNNPFYWQYKGTPVLLIGGSEEDNMFQHEGLLTQLDLLKQAGGNYVRNTMSSRDSGNVWPYQKNSEGLYDLNVPNSEYWDRFSQFLELTASRDIVVQIEVWATFDYYDDRDMRRGFWQLNPINPKNNNNYTEQSSGLPDTVASHPIHTENPFFFSVPSQDNNDILLAYQHAFVDRLLSYSLKYNHILYCMDNETSVPATWGAYWSTYIKQKAIEAGRVVYTTEMWDPWDLSHEMHGNTFDHPEIYDFVDVSQNNHNIGQTHWDNAQVQRDRILDSGIVRPMNNVKIYGSDAERFGTANDAQERFWRNIFGGMASARFHRPSSGLGLGQEVHAQLTSARLFVDAFDVFSAHPTLSFIQGRQDNEAYGMALPGQAYAVYFPRQGEVELAIEEYGERTVIWLDIMQSSWVVQENDYLRPLQLSPPGPGMWVAIVEIRP